MAYTMAYTEAQVAAGNYGDGALYQRCEKRWGCPEVVEVPRGDDPDTIDRVRPDHTCAARWYGVIEAPGVGRGRRPRITVSAKTEREAKKKLARRRAEIARGEVAADLTVRQWVPLYIELRKKPPKALRPNALAAAASPLKKWVVPNIGHRKLSALTPADLRAVAEEQYKAGRKTSTADATQRAFITSLNRAVQEGHAVPQRVLKAPRPGMGKSDRLDVPIADAIACLEVASRLPHGIRWVLCALYGARQGEVLGLVEDCVDFERNEIRLEWQLDTLRYVDRSDPAQGFQIPRDMEVRHLVGSYHLTRPKTSAGVRVLPMPEAVALEMKKWLAIRPDNPWGLVFPTLKGTPTNDKNDRTEWWAIQGTAEVGHPDGRWWHIHECRNLTATQLDEAEVPDAVITALLGHTSILTSRKYSKATHEKAKRDAVEGLATLLELGGEAI